MEEIIILTIEGCPACDYIKKHSKNSKVKILDVSKDDNAALLAAQNNIFSVPTAIKKKSDNKIEKCDLDISDKIIVKCKNQEIEI